MPTGSVVADASWHCLLEKGPMVASVLSSMHAPSSGVIVIIMKLFERKYPVLCSRGLFRTKYVRHAMLGQQGKVHMPSDDCSQNGNFFV